MDGIVSVSSGALFGVNYLSEQRGRSLRYNKKYIKDANYISFRSWLRTGNLVNKEFAYYTIPEQLDIFDEDAFEKSGVPFYVTVTNLETGKAEYHLLRNVFDQMELLRASSALPVVSKIVTWQGNKYLDGGLADSVPIDFSKGLGYDRLIVILTRPLGYRKKASSGIFYKLLYHRYPKFVEVATKRYQQYNNRMKQIEELEQKGELFVIRPSHSLEIGRLEKNSDKFDDIYRLGLGEGKESMGALKAYLSEGSNSLSNP